MRLIPEFLGHAYPEPSLAKSRSQDVSIPKTSFDYTFCLAFSGIAGRCLTLGIGLSRESYYFGCLVPHSLDGTFRGILLFLLFWVDIDPKANLNGNIPNSYLPNSLIQGIFGWREFCVLECPSLVSFWKPTNLRVRSDPLLPSCFSSRFSPCFLGWLIPEILQNWGLNPTSHASLFFL
jgi:hypothetical protein